MDFKLIVFISCVLVAAYGRRHPAKHFCGLNHRQKIEHRWYRHDPLINFEVQDPKGLTVTMVQRSPSTKFFGIELYVNRNPKQNVTRCDVCGNSTTVVYGKFIVQDEEVVIRKGDVLYYYVLLGTSDNVTRLQLQKILVTASVINRCNCETASTSTSINPRSGQTTASPKPSESSSTFVVTLSSSNSTEVSLDIDDQLNELSSEEYFPYDCDPDPVTNQCRTAQSEKYAQPSYDSKRDVDILEAIIEQIGKTPCGARSTTNMLRLESTSLPTNTLEHLTSIIQSSLSFNLEMKDLATRIRNIVPDKKFPSAVFFEMFSYVEKQKVLYYARMNNLKHISDYDSRHYFKKLALADDQSED
ncbi:uncharacterized protein LOC134217442 [Armigeres subalbatus]|uniref:uncharacterized protein LOC134217442 n=1 Tax=Armigeres subalbatus TaxID=124917 RepID=UPI002ED27539